jgi:hypothetical protein
MASLFIFISLYLTLIMLREGKQKTDLRYRKIGEPNSHNKIVLLLPTSLAYNWQHGLRTSGEEIALPARPKINSQSQIFRCCQSVFCLLHRPKFSDFFDWVSLVHDWQETNKSKKKRKETLLTKRGEKCALAATIADVEHGCGVK